MVRVDRVIAGDGGNDRLSIAAEPGVVMERNVRDQDLALGLRVGLVDADRGAPGCRAKVDQVVCLAIVHFDLVRGGNLLAEHLLYLIIIHAIHVRANTDDDRDLALVNAHFLQQVKERENNLVPWKDAGVIVDDDRNCIFIFQDFFEGLHVPDRFFECFLPATSRDRRRV